MSKESYSEYGYRGLHEVQQHLETIKKLNEIIEELKKN